jgi:hypothetical protein
MQFRATLLGSMRSLPIVLVFGLAVTARGADPLGTVCQAFRASDGNLVSGIGNGTYRYYDANEGNDWDLKVDSEFWTGFDGKKYHAVLTFFRDAFRGNSTTRILFDGNAVTTAWFAPSIFPTGAQGLVSPPQDYGDNLARPDTGDFPWDITKLARNVWDPEKLRPGTGPRQLDIQETREGDITGTYLLDGTARVRVRFECPRRFGYNVAVEQVFNAPDERPAQESRLEWKQSPTGLWYVRSLEQRFVLREANLSRRRVRRVLKYSAFEPNARVEPSMFSVDSLHMPKGTPIVDRRIPNQMPKYRKVL